MISIHALLAESDNRFIASRQLPAAFLSTLSLRRATIVMVGLLMCNLYFYPRSPCGERLNKISTIRITREHFYPRSPCGERPPRVLRHCTTYLFLSTLSLRRATGAISQLQCILGDFYPRSPCGERPIQTLILHMAHLFLSTLSLRRATISIALLILPIKFLSTLSLRRATSSVQCRL